MGPTLKVSFLTLLLVSLFLQHKSLLGSAAVEEDNPTVDNYCENNLGECLRACPRGWMFYKEFCYGLFEDARSWEGAEVMCQMKKRNAHLTSFLNEEELEEIAKYLTSAHISDHVWIGLFDPTRTRNWRWVDYAISMFLPWNVGEPNNADNNEYCSHLASDTGYKKMNDAPCSLELPYICKYAL